MTKVNINDIRSKIVFDSDTFVCNDTPIAPRIGLKKVNINDVNNLLRHRNTLPVVIAKYDVQLTDFSTDLQIDHMKSLIKIKAIRANRTGKVYDLAQERLFMRLSKIEQVKSVVDILDMGIDVVVDGYEEKAVSSNIDQLKKIIAKLEIEHKKKQVIINKNISYMARH